MMAYASLKLQKHFIYFHAARLQRLLKRSKAAIITVAVQELYDQFNEIVR